MDRHIFKKRPEFVTVCLPAQRFVITFGRTSEGVNETMHNIRFRFTQDLSQDGARVLGFRAYCPRPSWPVQNIAIL